MAVTGLIAMQGYSEMESERILVDRIKEYPLLLALANDAFRGQIGCVPLLPYSTCRFTTPCSPKEVREIRLREDKERHAILYRSLLEDIQPFSRRHRGLHPIPVIVDSVCVPLLADASFRPCPTDPGI